MMVLVTETIYKTVVELDNRETIYSWINDFCQLLISVILIRGLRWKYGVSFCFEIFLRMLQSQRAAFYFFCLLCMCLFVLYLFCLLCMWSSFLTLWIVFKAILISSCGLAWKQIMRMFHVSFFRHLFL